MSAKEFREAKEIIENRLKAFAGNDNYLIKEDADSNLTIITPLDIYHNLNIPSVVKSFISRPAKLFFCDENGRLNEITPEDFINVEKNNGKQKASSLPTGIFLKMKRIPIMN